MENHPRAGAKFKCELYPLNRVNRSRELERGATPLLICQRLVWV